MICKKLGKYLLVAACIFTGIAIGTPAVQAASLNMHYSDYWYNRAKADGSDHHSWHYTLYEVDGEVAYCIEPNIQVTVAAFPFEKEKKILILVINQE